MAEFVWQGQTTAIGITGAGATDKFGFYGAAFNDAIATGSYQDSIHLETAGNADLCSPHLMTTKYISNTEVSITGGTTKTLSPQIPTGSQCPLKITFLEDPAVAISNATFWADDGAVSTNPPLNVAFYAGEAGDAAWTEAKTSASGVSLTDQTSATGHVYNIFMTASPKTVGVKTSFRLQMELTYQ